MATVICHFQINLAPYPVWFKTVETHQCVLAHTFNVHLLIIWHTVCILSIDIYAHIEDSNVLCFCYLLFYSDHTRDVKDMLTALFSLTSTSDQQLLCEKKKLKSIGNHYLVCLSWCVGCCHESNLIWINSLLFWVASEKVVLWLMLV